MTNYICHSTPRPAERASFLYGHSVHGAPPADLVRPFTSPTRGEALPPETTINTGDGRLLLRLADGSDVVVRPHTRLLLKPEETGSWGYILKLLIGRINAQIQKRLGGTPPVRIGTPSAVISVRGTRFEVEVDSRGSTQVDVEEGVVALNSANGEGEGVLVTAGFSSRVSVESRGSPATPDLPAATSPSSSRSSQFLS